MFVKSVEALPQHGTSEIQKRAVEDHALSFLQNILSNFAKSNQVSVLSLSNGLELLPDCVIQERLDNCDVTRGFPTCINFGCVLRAILAIRTKQ